MLRGCQISHRFAAATFLWRLSREVAFHSSCLEVTQVSTKQSSLRAKLAVYIYAQLQPSVEAINCKAEEARNRQQQHALTLNAWQQSSCGFTVDKTFRHLSLDVCVIQLQSGSVGKTAA